MAMTVPTLTIIGFSADSSAAGGSNSEIGRRLIAIASMFAGALVGALLAKAGQGPWALEITGLLLVVVTISASRIIGSTNDWVTTSRPRVQLRHTWSSVCGTVRMSGSWAIDQVDKLAQRSSMRVRPAGQLHDREVHMTDMPVHIAARAADNHIDSKRIRAGIRVR